MAAGQGFIEFATGDVLTAASANGYLASQVVMVFADAAARTAAITSPQEGMISYLKDTNATQYYSGSAWVAIGGASGGKLLQVVQGTYSTITTIASTSMTDTGLSLAITPTSATSKILVMVNHLAHLQRQSSENGYSMRIMRGATEAFLTGATSTNVSYFYNAGSTDFAQGLPTALCYLDSPATTSSTTYKTQARIQNTANSGSVIFQPGSSTSVITLMEIGA
jgi:hypothetical protein